MTAPHAIASEWREADAGFSSVATTCLEHARTSDLVVLAQRDDRWAYAAHVEEPDRVAIGAGRPVLVLPTTTVSQLPPKRATVAWNGGREAARALFDALPLLADTEAVEILSIDPRPDGRGSDLPGTDLAVTLARHGLKADVSTSTSGSDGAGAEIARRAAAFGSDLVVMGCYGHSRLREFVLGGASRHMLAHAKLPVLMSH
jgi:nucleotide-binding universal stress UspA family protein